MYVCVSMLIENSNVSEASPFLKEICDLSKLLIPSKEVN